MTQKVRVVADDKISKAFPRLQSAVVEIRTKGGTTESDQVDYPKGEPENPLSAKEFEERFLELLRFAGKNDSQIERIYRTVGRERKVRELLSLL